MTADLATISGFLWWFIFHIICHDDAMTWERFLYYWPFVRAFQRWIPWTNYQWCGAFLFPLFLVLISYWTNTRVSGGLRPHDAHVLYITVSTFTSNFPAVVENKGVFIPLQLRCPNLRNHSEHKLKNNMNTEALQVFLVFVFVIVILFYFFIPLKVQEHFTTRQIWGIW